GKEPLGVHQRVVDGEMLFEPDLAFHEVLPFGRNPIRPAPKSESRPVRGGFSISARLRQGFGGQIRFAKFGGARRDRTADLLHAMQALSQLSYGPEFLSERWVPPAPYVSSSFAGPSPMMSVTSS